MAGETESYLDVRGIRQWYQLWLSTHVGLHTSNIQQIRGKFCFPSNRQTSAGEDFLIAFLISHTFFEDKLIFLQYAKSRFVDFLKPN